MDYYYEYPRTVLYYHPDEHESHFGIAYGHDVINSNSGAAYDTEDVDILREYEGWAPLEEGIAEYIDMRYS